MSSNMLQNNLKGCPNADFNNVEQGGCPSLRQVRARVPRKQPGFLHFLPLFKE